MFCLDNRSLQAAHIIAQKTIALDFNIPTLLEQAGLKHKHEGPNGMLLCIKCHDLFDRLKLYVDKIDEKLVLKVFKESNDKNSQNYLRTLILLENNRNVLKAFFQDNRMALYFISEDAQLLPNQTMAGGAEEDDEYCSCDDDYIEPVPVGELKRRLKKG